MPPGSKLAAPAVFLLALLIASAGQAGPAEDQVRIRRRLSLVESLLRARTPPEVPEERHAARLRSLDLLRAYVAQGAFPMNTRHPGVRVPYFIDEGGVPCAVAHLMIETGSPDLANRIAEADNNVYADQLSDPEVAAWAASSGLTLGELELIQPSYAPPDVRVEAVKTGDLVAVKKYLGTQESARTMMRNAVYFSQVKVIQLLMSNHVRPEPADLCRFHSSRRFRPNDGQARMSGSPDPSVTPAMRAETGKLLVGAGLDVNGLCPYDGLLVTPLYLSTAGRQQEIVELLLGLGADPRRPGCKGILKDGSAEASRRLPPRDSWADGETPLELAGRNGYSGILRLFLKLPPVAPGSVVRTNAYEHERSNIIDLLNRLERERGLAAVQKLQIDFWARDPEGKVEVLKAIRKRAERLLGRAQGEKPDPVENSKPKPKRPAPHPKQDPS